MFGLDLKIFLSGCCMNHDTRSCTVCLVVFVMRILNYLTCHVNFRLIAEILHDSVVHNVFVAMNEPVSLLVMLVTLDILPKWCLQGFLLMVSESMSFSLFTCNDIVLAGFFINGFDFNCQFESIIPNYYCLSIQSDHPKLSFEI